MISKTLIIGYGNSLRGDDGIGPAVARALASEAPAAIDCHQLTPELAECLAEVELAVFVDAAVNTKPGIVVVHELQGASARSSALVHSTDPKALLDLTMKLYGRSPRAFLVTIGVSSMALGEVLSEAAAEAFPKAVAAVRRLVSDRVGEG